MRLSLRLRILLTLVPLMVLLGVVGGAGVVLLMRLGGSIDLILKENYASVIAMERLNESLERIDSSFQFDLAGKGEKARKQYDQNWQSYREALGTEQNNITIHPAEDQLVQQLLMLTERYRHQGDDFFAGLSPAGRGNLYFGVPEQPGLPGKPGLLRTFEEIKGVSGQILHINQENMEEASHKSRDMAARSVLWLGVGLAAAVILAAVLSLHTIHTILQPIRAVTRSALAIGQGNFDQVLSVTSRDELGQLADAFNTMGRQLRHYRQTDYARLLRAQRTSQATIDSFPDPVLVVDAEGHVELANPAARQLFGIKPRGTTNEAVLPWQAPDPLRQPLDEALRQQSDYRPEGFDKALPLRCGDRDCFFLPRILSIRDPYENTLGAAVLLQDVTRFQLLDQVKSNLVATVSHELKTPLTSIQLAVHLLLEETVGALLPKQTELLLDARANADRLLATINNLLDLTHLERGPEWLETRPVAPGSLLEAAAEAVRPRAEDKGVTIQLAVAPDLPAVEVDVRRLGHALTNLLDNALAYTSRGGSISLSAAAGEGNVILAVADTGSGIPSEHLPHVFERFFRVPGQSVGKGTGLGLAIVHEIVTAHRGSIHCESSPGKGTVFCITLPIWIGASTAALLGAP